MIFFRFIRIIFDRQTVQQTCYPFLYRLYYRHLSYPQKTPELNLRWFHFVLEVFYLDDKRRFSSLIIYCSFVIIIMLFVCYFICPVLCKATAIYSVFSCFISDFGSASSRQAYVHVIKCTTHLHTSTLFNRALLWVISITVDVFPRFISTIFPSSLLFDVLLLRYRSRK